MQLTQSYALVGGAQWLADHGIGVLAMLRATVGEVREPLESR
jgi:hypothetical protein